MKFNNNEEAVSPVIGVILMVAITVILAAVIAVFVFGMADSMEGSKSVAVTSKTVNATALVFTFQGGPDANIVDYIKFANFDSKGTLNTSAAPSTSHGTAVAFTGGSAEWKKPAVGESITIGSLKEGHMTLTAYFTDGTNQQLLNKQF